MPILQAALLTALSLCASAPTPATILRAPDRSRGYGWMTVDSGDGEPWPVEVVPGETVIRWHLDPAVSLPPTDLHPGTRVRLTVRDSIATRVVVVTLGPRAMEAAVEEFVAANGRRCGLSASELAAVDALAAPCWTVRRDATRALAERGVEALRPLIFARRHRDAEVRARAGVLLERLGW
jgi:hypothetical protein